MTKMLKRVLQDVLSEEENEQLISAFDQIGDIIVAVSYTHLTLPTNREV